MPNVSVTSVPSRLTGADPENSLPGVAGLREAAHTRRLGDAWYAVLGLETAPALDALSVLGAAPGAHYLISADMRVPC